MLAEGGSRIPGGLGDTRLVHFSLEHGHRYLLGIEGHRDFWSPPIFYPARGIAAYTDTLLSLLPFYTPWRLLGASPVRAFQLWWLAVFVLNFVAFHAYLRRIFGLAPLAATSGAFLFTFGSARLVDLGHPQMMPWFYIVLALFASHRIVESLAGGKVPRRWLAALAVALVLQAYAAVYPLFFFGLGLVVWTSLVVIVVAASGARRRELRTIVRSWRRIVPAALLAMMLALFAVLPLAAKYQGVRATTGDRQWAGVEPRIPRLSSWFLMGAEHRLYGSLSDRKAESRPGWPARSSNHANGLGFLSLGLVALGSWLAVRQRRDTAFLLATAVLVAALATIYPGGFTPWRWIFEHFPAGGAIRAVGRIGMVSLIPAAIALGFLVNHLLGRPRLRWAIPLALSIVVVEQLQELPSFDGRDVYGSVQHLAEGLPPDCPAFFLSPANPGSVNSIHEDAMWVAAFAGIPTINGRYGNRPPGWRLTEIATRGGLARDEIARRLRAWLTVNSLSADSVCWFEVEPSGTRQHGAGAADRREIDLSTAEPRPSASSRP